jgi:hypothetical protein
MAISKGMKPNMPNVSSVQSALILIKNLLREYNDRVTSNDTTAMTMRGIHARHPNNPLPKRKPGAACLIMYKLKRRNCPT